MLLMSMNKNERKKQKSPIHGLKFPGGDCPKKENPDPQSLFLKKM